LLIKANCPSLLQFSYCASARVFSGAFYETIESTVRAIGISADQNKRPVVADEMLSLEVVDYDIVDSLQATAYAGVRIEKCKNDDQYQASIESENIALRLSSKNISVRPGRTHSQSALPV
jgi:hypothetical protein